VIRWEERGPVGLATIDRQERRNALNAELCDDLRGRLSVGGHLRAVVITGAGSAFCAGADLATRFDDREPEPDTFRVAFEGLMDAAAGFPAPVIAAVNGPALGAGTQLAVACDLRIAGPAATFGVPAAKIGIVLSSFNIERLALLVGQGVARDLLLTGRTVDAAEAARLGLVSRGADDALPAALALAGEIAALAPITVANHKRALNLLARAQSLDDAGRTEAAGLEQEAVLSRDLREGIAAFTEKREPRFEGR
jgi:enoyl-CoA hydratase